MDKNLPNPSITAQTLTLQVVRFIVANAPLAKGWLMHLLVRLILVTYTIFMVKPVMPVVMDHLAHAFWANVHFATVHMHNGKAHVHYELRNTVNDNEKDKSTQKYKSSTEDDVHLAGIIHGALVVKLLFTWRTLLFVFFIRSHNNAEQTIESPPPRPESLFPVSHQFLV